MKVVSVSRMLAGFAVGLVVALPLQAQDKVEPKQKESKSGQSQVTIDPKLPDYKPGSGVSGNLKSIGSDTMNNLMALWAEGFHKIYPNVEVEIEGKGSTTAPTALIAGTAHFGPMSRPMKDAEINKFQAKFGYKPTALPSSIDMLAVYVHKDNPIKSLTLQQVDGIFSSNRKAGGQNIRTWGDLGLTGEWANKPISLYGRNSASGTYGFFKEHVLLNGDYKDSVKEQPGSSSVVQGVASDKYAIGYSGIGYKTADVKAVPLARNAKAKVIEAIPENAYTGQYPLARFLLIYVNYKPKSELDPLRREFIKYVFSKQGQQDVIKDGYFPVLADIAMNALKSVGISETGESTEARKK
jgi:phosphate transport system substrate-binding protein